MTRVALRLLAATVAACVALLLGAAPAFAHTRLESSDPGDKSSVDTAPTSVSLTFNEAISAEFATLSRGRSGRHELPERPGVGVERSGEHRRVAARARRCLRDRLPGGVRRRPPRVGEGVVHADHGRPRCGRRSGDRGAHRCGAPAPLPAPATTAVDPQADSRSSEGAPIWPWLVGAVILVAAGAAVALRLSRRS